MNSLAESRYWALCYEIALVVTMNMNINREQKYEGKEEIASCCITELWTRNQYRVYATV
jgi:hypothetical protein